MQKSKPLVSFIIPCYKQWQWLPECLASIKAQTIKDFEIILVSETDDQFNELAKFKPNVDKVLWHQQHIGLAASRTAALGVVSGKYVVPVDADDTIDPAFLMMTLKVAKEDKKSLAAVVVNGHAKLTSEISKNNYLNYCALYRTEVLKYMNGWQQPSDKAQALEDWDLWIRLWQADYNIGSVDHKLFHWRRTHGSMSSKIEGTGLFHDIKMDMLRKNGLA